MITAFERNWEIQPMRKTTSSRKRTPVTKVIEATSVRISFSDALAAITAPAATAARAELGPVAIWREVPSSA